MRSCSDRTLGRNADMSKSDGPSLLVEGLLRRNERDSVFYNSWCDRP